MTLQEMAQDIIKSKQEFASRFGGLKEHQYNKLDLEVQEVLILEYEEYYIETCHEQSVEPDVKVLEWNL